MANLTPPQKNKQTEKTEEISKNKPRTDSVVTYIYLYKYSLHELSISIIGILTNMKSF